VKDDDDQGEFDFEDDHEEGEPFRFNGPDYEPRFDQVRLTGQIKRVWQAMVDGGWRSLTEIEVLTRDPQASISAQLRHLKKERFGSHTVEHRPRGDRRNGLFEYRLTPNPNCRIDFGEDGRRK
jgi:hypothetical protein